MDDLAVDSIGRASNNNLFQHHGLRLNFMPFRPVPFNCHRYTITGQHFISLALWERAGVRVPFLSASAPERSPRTSGTPPPCPCWATAPDKSSADKRCWPSKSSATRKPRCCRCRIGGENQSNTGAVPRGACQEELRLFYPPPRPCGVRTPSELRLEWNRDMQ
jgi:hypothetical protein